MLEREEKVAGRLFRDQASAKLQSDFANVAPAYPVPPVLGNYRHPCDAKDGLSTPLDLKEIWVPSPRIVVERADDDTLTAFLFDDWVFTTEVDTWHVPEGRFGFVYRHGRCRYCGKVAMSSEGRIVDALERPPLDGRMVG